MYGGYNPTGGSPPLPDIIGPYYATGAYGLPPPAATAYASDSIYSGIPSTSYLYDPPFSTAGIYGSTSPIRRRRYSIAGLPSATMMNDYYGHGMYPSTSAAAFGMQTPLQHASSSNLVNLLNETHKSISRSSQILNHHARMQQFQQPMTPIMQTHHHYPGRVISSYPTLHPGGEISPHYLSDNLLQMSASFSSQPNMYFQQYNNTPAGCNTLTGANTTRGGLLRPAYSVSNLTAPMTHYTSRYNSGGVGLGSSYPSYPYNQSLLNHSDLPYILQQRQLLSSLHASNPAISQYYQQQLPHYLQHYAQQPSQLATSATQPYNLQQQFAGAQQQYGGGGHHLPTSSSLHPASHIHHSVAQQLNPNHQYHVHSQQNHLQTHPLASLVNSSSPFSGQLASSGLMGADTRHLDSLHTATTYHAGTQPMSTQQSSSSAAAAAAAQHLQQQQQQQPPPTHHHHHPHIHHPTAPHTHHPTPHHMHHHHQSPYTKIDLDYPKIPQEHKRQVSFKFDVDQLSLDS